MNRIDLENIARIRWDIASLQKQIEKMHGSTATDTVRGGPATASRGRGRLIPISGFPARDILRLEKRVGALEARLKQHEADFNNWADKQSDQIIVRMLELRYFMGLDDKEIGEVVGYKREVVNRKINWYLDGQDLN